MNEEFKEKAQQYLQEIEAARIPPVKRSSWRRQKFYVSSMNYARQYKATSEEILLVDVKNNIGGCIIFPLWVIVQPIVIFGWTTNVRWIEAVKTLLVMMSCVAAAIFFQRVPGKYVWLRLTHHGLWVTEENTLVKWHHIIWAGIETIPDNEDSDELNFILNYYDERYDTFREFRTNMQKLSIRPAELCFYIEYFRNQSTKITSTSASI
jgi:hypothetical protein